jgi:uroporphyrinogen-III decarboxylase
MSPEAPVRAIVQIPPEVKCEYAGVPPGEYYTDLEAMVRVSEAFPAAFEAATGHKSSVSYAPAVSPYEGVAALGAELTFPRDHQAMILNQGKVLTTPEEVDTLAVPDPWASERFRLHVDRYHALKERFGDRAGGGLSGQEGPITTAGLLRGEQFFVDCVTDPDRAHRLLQISTEMFILWRQVSDEVTGASPTVAGICDDYAGMLGPHLWGEFVIPYYRRIFDALGPKGGHIHTELVNRRHLPCFRDLNLVGVNFAEDEFLEIQDVFDELPGIPFAWHIKTCAEMLQGTPESIAQRFREIVAAGITQVNCEITVGTPPENIRAFLAMPGEYERA